MTDMTTSPASEPRKLVCLDEAADHFQVSRRTLEREIAEGRIPTYVIRSLRRLDLEEVRQALRVQRSSGPSEQEKVL